jgi:protein-tyrosine phosphatase
MSSNTYSSILTTNDIKWINYPIGDNGQSENPEMELKNGSKTHNPFYEWLPRYGSHLIVDVLKIILREEWPILVHCSAGRDRTGIVVALIQDIMGMERQSIIRSYLVSEGSRIGNICLFFEVVDDLGGPIAFLKENGFPRELITELIERLTPEWE